MIGRFDPKLDRKSGTLLIQKLVMEKDIRLAKEDIDRIAEAFRSFMSFHKADKILFEECEPAYLLETLTDAIENIAA